MIEKSPQGNEILNPLIPDATWDVSGLFSFDHQYRVLLNMGKAVYACDVPIKTVHGCFPVMWNAGRTTGVGTAVWGDNKTAGPEVVLKLWDNFWKPIGCYYTFSNPLINKKHLDDPSSNFLLDLLAKHNKHKVNGVIVSSDILSDYIREKYPELKQKASIIKSSTERSKVFGRDFEYYDELTERFDRIMVHPDDGHDQELLKQIENSGKQDSYEIIMNEACPIGCAVRKPCYGGGAKEALKGWNGMFHFYDFKSEFGASQPGEDPRCGRNNQFHPNPELRPTTRSCTFSLDELAKVYNMGFRHFKLQGRDDSWNYMFQDFMRYAMHQNLPMRSWGREINMSDYWGGSHFPLLDAQEGKI